MAEQMTLTIVWMDRAEPLIIRARLETRISDAVLHVYEYDDGTRILESHFPLANIRQYTKERK